MKGITGERPLNLDKTERRNFFYGDIKLPATGNKGNEGSQSPFSFWYYNSDQLLRRYTYVSISFFISLLKEAEFLFLQLPTLNKSKTELG